MKIATTKERILQFVDYKGISKTRFYEETGMRRGFLDGDKLKTSIPDTFIATIVATYPDISPIWLLTGEGSMLKNDVPSAVPAKEPGEGIPLIPINAIAGIARGEISILELECERFVVPVFKGADYLIQIRGSSMYPKYNSGDIVACQKIPALDLFLQWNKVYVIDTVQGALIKRVKQGRDNNHISLVSENLSYDPFELRIDQINAIALVIGVIRLE